MAILPLLRANNKLSKTALTFNNFRSIKMLWLLLCLMPIKLTFSLTHKLLTGMNFK